MKLLIVGASRGTGARLARLAIDRGHDVTAFARHPEALVPAAPRLTRFRGDFHDAAAIAAAVPGHDAVVVTAGAASLSAFREQPEFFTAGTRHVVEAMQQQRVQRLVILSALGVGDSLSLVNPLARPFVRLLLGIPFDDHARQEELVRATGLDWVIARPSRLTNGPARGRFVATPRLERVPGAIARADVAAFLLEAATTDRWSRQVVHLGG